MTVGDWNAEDGNNTAALKWYLKAAENGDVCAMTRAAMVYRNLHNYKEAMKLYAKAIAKGAEWVQSDYNKLWIELYFGKPASQIDMPENPYDYEGCIEDEEYEEDYEADEDDESEEYEEDEEDEEYEEDEEDIIGNEEWGDRVTKKYHKW